MKRLAFVFSLVILASFIAPSVGATSKKPSAPRSVKATISGSNVIVTFKSPATSGGGKVLRYNVKARPTNKIYTSTGTRYAVVGLPINTAFTFVVAAVNKYGVGPYSGASNAVMLRAPQITVTFDPGGGTGTMAVQSADVNSSVALTPNAYVFTGRSFDGWNTAPDGTGTIYSDGAIFAFTVNTTLYAQWMVTRTAGMDPIGSSPWAAGYFVPLAQGTYQSVGAQWRVPELNCTSTPFGHVVTSIGVEGTDGYVEVGVHQACAGSQQSAYLYWSSDSDYLLHPLGATAAGDLMKASVTLSSAGVWTYSITDLSRGGTSSGTASSTFTPDEVYWAVQGDSTGYASNPLGDFSHVTFAALAYTSTTAAFSAPAFQYAEAMRTTGGVVEAVPTPVLGSDAATMFTVYYTVP